MIKKLKKEIKEIYACYAVGKMIKWGLDIQLTNIIIEGKYVYFHSELLESFLKIKISDLDLHWKKILNRTCDVKKDN